MVIKRKINNKVLSTDGFAHLYNFTPHFMDINGHFMHYLDEGNGNPVVMIHGNPTWSFYFRHLVSVLSKTHRTIAMDHIGCGFSDKPDSRHYDYTLEQRAHDLEMLIEKLDFKQKITLIVHDWGGMIGLYFALKHIQRIEKIVITNTSGFALPENKRFPFRLWLIKYLTPFAVPCVLGLNLFSNAALFMAAEKKLTKDIQTGLSAPYNSWKNRIATLKFVQDIPLSETDRSFSAVRYVDDTLHRLASLPLLILWGKKDFVFDLTFLNEWKKRFPEADVHLFEDAGHYLFEDKPYETARLIQNFLQEMV